MSKINKTLDSDTDMEDSLLDRSTVSTAMNDELNLDSKSTTITGLNDTDNKLTARAKGRFKRADSTVFASVMDQEFNKSKFIFWLG